MIVCMLAHGWWRWALNGRLGRGQVVGPFLGAFFIQLYGFRGALIRWGGGFGLLGVGLGLRYCGDRRATKR